MMAMKSRPLGSVDRSSVEVNLIAADILETARSAALMIITMCAGIAAANIFLFFACAVEYQHNEGVGATDAMTLAFQSRCGPALTSLASSAFRLSSTVIDSSVRLLGVTKLAWADLRASISFASLKALNATSTRVEGEIAFSALTRSEDSQRSSDLRVWPHGSDGIGAFSP